MPDQQSHATAAVQGQIAALTAVLKGILAFYPDPEEVLIYAQSALEAEFKADEITSTLAARQVMMELEASARRYRQPR